MIPIGSYQIATEALGAERVRSLIPHGRNIVDSRRVVVYFRPSADGERIIFGGRAALAEKDPLACVPRLRAMLTRIFPQLQPVADHPCLGGLGRVHLRYACRIWVSATDCSTAWAIAARACRSRRISACKIGQQMAGLAEGRTALDSLPFPSRPYYFGRPWFLAPSVWAFRALDSIGW